jgi:hypothetical protein
MSDSRAIVKSDISTTREIQGVLKGTGRERDATFVAGGGGVTTKYVSSFEGSQTVPARLSG